MKKIIAFIVLLPFLILMYPLFVNAQASDSESDTHYVLGRYFYSEPTIDDQIFSISSKTINGSIDNVYQNVGDAGINFSIESSSSGFLHVEIPRNYPYSNSFFDPFVVVNDKEKGLGSDYTLNEAECFYEYEIPFTGDSLIEILFGQIAVDEPFVSEIIPLQCIEETIVDDDSIVVDISYLSPLDQFESGKKINDIQCSYDLQLIERSNGKPACVKSETSEVLVNRSMAKII